MMAQAAAKAGLYSPERSEFLRLAQDYDLVPIYREVLADEDTPISVFRKLVGDAPGYLLESVEGGERAARYSFIGAEPFLTVRSYGPRVLVEEQLIGAEGAVSALREELEGNPLKTLRQLLQRRRMAPAADLPRFYGGLVGYLGYDLVRFVERLPNAPPDDRGLADVQLMATDLVIIFDHVKHSVRIVCNARIPRADQPGAAPGEAVLDAVYRAAQQRIEAAMAKLRQPADVMAARAGATPQVRANTTREAYEAAVRKAKEYIAAGDIFQVVLSQRWEVPYGGHPLDVYRSLRVLNPSPYMFYLNFGDAQLAGASPELLVRLENGHLETRPIAGTRRRGRNKEEDLALEAELLADQKESAEHLMLVDLGRNDLGRVSRFGSVKVSRFMAVERYSHVMHLVSDVEGDILPEKDALDALAACFPAGTLSGAPKVRAMEIIDELEPARRGPYGGAVGYFGFTGNMDTCITIRTAVFHGGKAYVQAGAGIVADSDPAAEYQECVHKAGAVLRALGLEMPNAAVKV